VQPHINKCFEGCRALDFAPQAVHAPALAAAAGARPPAAAAGPPAAAAGSALVVRPTPEILGLVSPEGERLALIKVVKVR